jgi:hypothetical protein
VEKKLSYQDSKLSLNDLFVSLIAEHDNIDTSEVTVDYILEQRETKIYPSKRFDHGSRFGGYDDIGLSIYSGKELTLIDELAESVFDGI